MWLDESDEYSRTKHHNGALAVGVPGTVAGFWKSHQLYGSQDWERLLRPAVGLAQDGFELTDRLARGLRRLVEGRGADYAGTLTYFSNNGRPYSSGSRLTQADLGRTLERIALEGRDGFYAGETARLLVAEMELETTELASWLLDAPPPLATAEAAPPVPPVDCVLAPPLPELALPPALLLVSSSMPLCVPLAAHAALMTSERNANRWCWVGDMITAIMP
jgi:hypothetical protein